MKNTVVRTVVLAITVSAVLACGVLAVLYVRYGAKTPAPEEKHASEPYTLGVWEGELAVFERDASFPMKLYDVSVAALPADEQEKLRAGIPVTAEELQRLLEDYTS